MREKRRGRYLDLCVRGEEGGIWAELHNKKLAVCRRHSSPNIFGVIK